jgi:hypothetical protein
MGGPLAARHVLEVEALGGGLVAAGGYLLAILGHGLPVLLAGWIWSASASA